ncbi:hypothetical protein M8494_19260 [Serratia ureilytica]
MNADIKGWSNNHIEMKRSSRPATSTCGACSIWAMASTICRSRAGRERRAGIE